MKLNKLLIHVILIMVSITMIVPFAWMALTAFKTVTESTSVNPFTIFPAKWITSNFTEVINNMDFMKLYLNTLLLIVGRVFFAVMTSTIAGYALARLDFPGKTVCFGLVLFQMMVPSQIFIIPQYLMVSKLGMLDTIFALIFPGLVSAFGTFLLRQTFMSLPRDLEEAARIDGAGHIRILFSIVLPLSKPVLAVMLLYYGVGVWNGWFWASTILTDRSMYPLQVILREILLSNDTSVMTQGVSSGDLEAVGATIRYATVIVATLPILCAYPFLQKYFTKGIMIGAVKE